MTSYILRHTEIVHLPIASFVADVCNCPEDMYEKRPIVDVAAVSAAPMNLSQMEWA